MAHQHREDEPHASEDLGNLPLAVRSDTAASTGGTDGDYSALITDSTGRLHVNASAGPAAIEGAGSPSVDSYATAAVNLAAGTADQELVADPGASKQIWVFGLFVMADTGAGTIALQDEDNLALTGVMAVSDEGGFVLPPPGNFSQPWLIVTTNKALEADTTGTGTFDGIITYAIVSV